MEISDKMVAEFKEIYRKNHGKDLSDSDARESASSLLGLMELLWELSVKDQKRKARLKKEPDGFPVDGQYSCLTTTILGNGYPNFKVSGQHSHFIIKKLPSKGNSSGQASRAR